MSGDMVMAGEWPGPLKEGIEALENKHLIAQR